MAKMAEQCRGVVLEAIGQKQWGTVRRQCLGHLMHHALRHGQGAGTDIDYQ
jgi:hypothetical protein